MNEEPLYDTFGELLCALVRTEKGISSQVTNAIQTILKPYEWGEQVFWSFTYESKHNRSVQEAYERALDAFADFGPSDKYAIFLEILSRVAHRYAHTDYQKRLPEKFAGELLEKMQGDITLRSDDEDDE